MADSYHGSFQRSSPLRAQDENELIKAFKEELLLERDLEKAKRELVEACHDYNLYDAFKVIDRDNKGFASAFDIKDACLSTYGLDLPEVTIEDIELFMVRYDKNNDRKIRFSEFSAAFSPLDSYLHQKLQLRRAESF